MRRHSVSPRPQLPQRRSQKKGRLTWGALVSQELPLTLPLAPAGTVARLPAGALLVLVMETSRVEAACALPDGEQVAGSLAFVDTQFARCVLNALPLLQKPTGTQLTDSQADVIY